MLAGFFEVPASLLAWFYSFTHNYAVSIALIAVVGEDMANSIGIAAKLFIALRDAEVNVRVINQGSSELNIIVGVSPTDYERAVNAIYRAFVG